jgi:LPXTG-site transpeptidase (sortase) family protein
MNKIYGIVILAGLAVGVYFGIGFAFANKTEKASVTQSSEINESPTPTSVRSPEVPVRIIIPNLQVETEIESVTVDSNGNMDVPKDWNNTAWYSLGPKPGEKGSSVIDGHLDTPSGDPAIFANISNLKKGDEIKVIDEKNNTYTFSVFSVKNYELSEMPLDEIFSRNTEPMLNLITCSGVFDQNKKMYTHRTVVYSTLKEI